MKERMKPLMPIRENTKFLVTGTTSDAIPHRFMTDNFDLACEKRSEWKAAGYWYCIIWTWMPYFQCYMR